MGKLTQACQRGDSLGIYKALREDMAEQLECTESGRDYAAIAKSLIAVQERIDSMPASKRKQGTAATTPANGLARARQKNLKVVNG